MKTGIIGLARAGKATVFEALTGSQGGEGRTGEARVGTIRVPDPRVDALSKMYNPKKTTYAQVEYFLPGKHAGDKKDQSIWNQVRDCDALIHVVRNFGGYGFDDPEPLADFQKLEQELIFADLVVAEKRMERLEGDLKRGKKEDPEELALIKECHGRLEQEIPLRKFPELAAAPKLRGFTFLSAKPILVLFNNTDDDEDWPEAGDLPANETCLIIRGKLEQELAQMSKEEAEEFLKEFNVGASALDRIIEKTYERLGLLSFFTVGEDEVRAWTIRSGATALDAAGEIHTDLQKGFIRAETISYEDLMETGGFNEAKKKGTLRLEGKTYEVQDGDVMQIRFNV